MRRRGRRRREKVVCFQREESGSGRKSGACLPACVGSVGSLFRVPPLLPPECLQQERNKKTKESPFTFVEDLQRHPPIPVPVLVCPGGDKTSQQFDTKPRGAMAQPPGTIIIQFSIRICSGTGTRSLLKTEYLMFYTYFLLQAPPLRPCPASPPCPAAPASRPGRTSPFLPRRKRWRRRRSS